MRKAASVMLFSTVLAASPLALAATSIGSHVSGSANHSVAGTIHASPINTSAKTGASANGSGSLAASQNRGSLSTAGKASADASASDSATVDVSKGK
jgi:hypothetical protein